MRLANLLLVTPPLTDPTAPYHSTAYLAGSLRAAGYSNVWQRDANAEFVDWCLREEAHDTFVRAARERAVDLGAMNSLSLEGQSELHALFRDRPRSADELRAAVACLRSLPRFLDYGEYAASVDAIRAQFRFIGALSFPAQIEDFILSTGNRFSLVSWADLMNDELSARACWAFYRFLDAAWADDPMVRRAKHVGISITFQHQLLHALALARWLRAHWPEKRIVLGGAEVSQIYRAVRDPLSLRNLFKFCDAFVVGEGETAVRQLAEQDFAPKHGAGLSNVVTYDPSKDRLYLPSRLHFESMENVAPPVYDCRWDVYLSPTRAVHYAPTRGCYWNRCAFCSYGLVDDRPTAPFRAVPAQRVARELKTTCDVHRIEYVYFAVDAMSPAYLRQLADSLIDAGTSFRWSAELRLEKVFSLGLCEKLARSGCVSALFGMESGCQRMLDAMDKGTQIAEMEASMRNFAAAGIAVQLMTFAGFPTETASERNETLRFVERCSAHWANGGMGGFTLLSGSRIAREPEAFGVTIRPVDGADVDAILEFDVADSLRAAPEQPVSPASIFPSTLPGPWAGGRDTLHSLIYYRQHGVRVFRERDLPTTAAPPPPCADAELLLRVPRWRTAPVANPFDLRGIHSRILATDARLARCRRDGVEPTYAEYQRIEEEVEPEARGDKPRFWLYEAGHVLEVPEAVVDLVASAQARSRTVGDIIGQLSPEIAARLASYLWKLGLLGALEFAGDT